MRFLRTLFRSRAERDADNRIRFRQGKARIQRFVQQCRRSSDKYWALCRQAYQLGDNEQFQQLALHHLNARRAVNRWERFLVKLEALEMRRDEVAATEEFLRGMENLSRTILSGATPEDIGRMQSDMLRAIDKSKAQVELLDVAMEACGASLLPDETDDQPLVDMLRPVLEVGGVAGRSDPPGHDKLDAEIAKALRELEISRSFKSPPQAVKT